VLLIEAANWNVDREADVEPIRHLIDIGCDLEADILPTVRRTVTELARPLRSWAQNGLNRKSWPRATGASLMRFPGGLIRLILCLPCHV
jgi:hypothetical protein